MLRRSAKRYAYTQLLVLLLATSAWAEPCCSKWGVGGFSGGGVDDFGNTPPANAVGCFTGNAVDDRLIVSGFPPAFVLLDEMDNDNPSSSTYRYDHYQNDYACQTAAASDLGCDSDHIQSFPSTGFVVGADADVNANGQPICWMALGASANFVDVGFYQGDGQSGRNIPTEFVPDMLLITKHDTSGAVNDPIFFAVLDGLPTYANWSLNVSPQETGGILSFNAATEVSPPSFTISGSGTNGNGVLYDFLALNQQTGAVDQGVAIGEGDASQTITTSCTSILAVLIAGEDSGIAGWRTSAMLPNFVTEGTSNAFFARPGNGTDEATCLGRISGSSFDLLGSTVCNESGETYLWAAICVGASLQTVAAYNPLANLRVFYDMESAAGAGLTNAVGTQCGSDCDMVDVNAVGRSTAEFREGTQSALFNGTDETFTCARATCANGTTDLNVGGSMSWGCWGRLTNDTNSRGAFYGGGTAGNNANWALLRNATNDLINCRITTTGDSAVTAAGNTNTWQINTWAFRACTFDDTGDLLSVYRNAVLTGTPQAVTSQTTTLAADPRIGANQVLTATAFFEGTLDACMMGTGVWTTEQMCFLGSCGGDGTECTCLASNPTLYANNGYNDRMDNCTLPDCNTGGF